MLQKIKTLHANKQNKILQTHTKKKQNNFFKKKLKRKNQRGNKKKKEKIHFLKKGQDLPN
jgi:hypothetical protein